MPFSRLPIRIRLTLWSVAITFVIIGAFASATYLLVRTSLLRALDRQAQTQLDAVTAVCEEEPEELGELEDHGSVPLFAITHEGGTDYQTPAWGRAGLEQRQVAGGGAEVVLVRSTTGGLYRLNARAVRFHGHPAVASVAVPAGQTLATLEFLALSLAIALPGALLLAGLGGFILARRALAPVDEMAAQARWITAERLSDRLPIRNRHDELGRLAETFNELLGRLEASFAQLKRFTSDASHELRMPLTAIRSVGEVGLKTASSLEECRDVIGSILEETDFLTKLLSGLMFLTQADGKAFRLHHRPTDISRVLDEVVELLTPLAEEKGQALHWEHPMENQRGLTAEVDLSTVRQAILNILENAISYTPEHGTIDVRLTRRPEHCIRIEIEDTGPGIPEEARDRIFDRFFRLESARAQRHGGAGLGLAIARWAVEANKGWIELESRVGRGTTFSIVLPIASPGLGRALRTRKEGC